MADTGATTYQQLLQYKDALENPPLLVVCDLDRCEVRTNFTNTVQRIASERAGQALELQL